MAGWVVQASGDSKDPKHHQGLLDHLRELLGRPEYGTGSSEFNSPHAAESNFHQVAVQAPAAGAPAPAAGGAGSYVPPGPDGGSTAT